MSDTGTVVERTRTCTSCGNPIYRAGTVCSVCLREASSLATTANAPRATVKRSRVKPLTDAEIARGLGQADQLAAYRANRWQSGLRETPDDRPKAALGAGRITGTTAVPSHRLTDAGADRGQHRTRVPATVEHTIGKLAQSIIDSPGRVPRKCAELSAMLGEIARSGCISNARLRRAIDRANTALALAASR